MKQGGHGGQVPAQDRFSLLGFNFLEFVFKKGIGPPNATPSAGLYGPGWAGLDGTVRAGRVGQDGPGRPGRAGPGGPPAGRLGPGPPGGVGGWG